MILQTFYKDIFNYMKKPFIWDPYSDQPYPIKDKNYKKKMRNKVLLDHVELILKNLFMFPLSMLAMNFIKPKKSLHDNFYGIGVDLDKGKIQIELIKELGVKNLLIRLPLWQMDRIDEYLEFVKSFKNKNILLNILQDREHIENKNLLQKDITKVFELFSPYVNEYQIANAINRTKWGFFSTKEYLRWYKIIQDIRDKSYPNLKLIGPSVIDFEYHYTIDALFNFFDIEYDAVSSLLYVDRRGAPENRQMGIFDTKNKIKLLYTLTKLSPKIKNNTIYITEVNWPLINTAPYAPTSQKECVSEQKYNEYMIRYLKIAKNSYMISRVYWHQLIAPGYGLVDNRDGKIRKTLAFESFKKLIQQEKACN